MYLSGLDHIFTALRALAMHVPGLMQTRNTPEGGYAVSRPFQTFKNARARIGIAQVDVLIVEPCGLAGCAKSAWTAFLETYPDYQLTDDRWERRVGRSLLAKSARASAAFAISIAPVSARILLARLVQSESSQ